MSTFLGGFRRFSAVEVKIDANTIVNKGDHVASFADGNGYAKTLTATLNVVHLGRANETVDNTGGAAGAKTFNVLTGREVFVWMLKNDGTTPVAAANVYGKVYWSAAGTVSPDDAGATRPLAGRCWGLEADGKVLVEPVMGA